ncbi:MAG: Vitamin B12 dependent methionine synthase activation subunit [Clostridia bacterium]|nr:Vitamin B12 dependent methionine synthase activation subunit [Clostridia bacterium]
MTGVFTLSLPLPPVDESEVLRYAACFEPDENTIALLKSCTAEAQGVLQGRVCWCIAEVGTLVNGCTLGALELPSLDLRSNLSGCKEAVVFGATLGVGMDRLINKYGYISPAKALMLQALGSERIEALCDSFCKYIGQELGAHLRSRYSPGYGDLPLESQRDIFALLDCPKNIGLCLTEGLVMTPSKSVTAVCGIASTCLGSYDNPHKCGLCPKTDCLFRRTV